ncbi:hypothetical protein KI387_023746, partial [Taxus chinensis]
AETKQGYEKFRSTTIDDVRDQDFVDWKGRAAVKGKHGGIRATIFIYAAETLENFAFLGNGVNLVTYFHRVMHYDLKDSSNVLTNYMGTAFLLALFGAFISDSFITRFHTNIIFASVELIGYILLTVQAHDPSLRPPGCDILNPAMNCKHVEGKNSAVFYMGMYLVALGTGGLKAALPTMGAEQFDDKDPKESRKISSFFNWFFFSITVGAGIGVTLLVWIQGSKGWDWAFGISVGAFVLVILILLSGTTKYRNQVPRGSPLTKILQVVVAAIRNRNLPLPDNAAELNESGEKELVQNTQQFRFLDKAAIVSRGSSVRPWRMCTVTEVEQVKMLIRMAPIFGSTVMVSTCLAQLQTFSVQQGMTMNTHIGSFNLSPATLTIIPLIILVILTPLYDLVFVPFARRITGQEQGITTLQRIGVGLVLAATSMVVAAAVEVKRKGVALDHGMLDAIPVLQPLPISVMWLVCQYLVFGIADLFTVVGLLEFFYTQSHSSMKSMGTAITWCVMSLGYFLSTVVVDVVNKASGGWLHGNNLNRNHLNLFYWTVALLSFINFLNFLYWARWYKYKPLAHPKFVDNAA